MKLTSRQGFCLMTCFLLGNVLSGIGSGSDLEKTGYLSVFFSFLPLILLIFIYREILRRNNNRDFFELFSLLLGRTAGKILLIVIAFYSLLSAFFSMANLIEFIEKSTFFNTPKQLVLFISLLLILYLCFSREKAMGRYAEIVLPIVLFAVSMLFIFGWKQFNPEHIVFISSKKHFVKQGFKIFLSPFSEIIFVYLLFDMLKDKTKISKIAISSCTLTVFLFSAMYLFNLLILGKKLMASVPFPTFYAASVVEVGTVIENAETLITFSYTFCDLLYSGACLFLLSKSVQTLFPQHQNAKKITALSAVILIFVLLCIPKISGNLRQYYEWVAPGMIPLTLGIPMVLLLATLFKKPNTKGHSPKSCNNGDPQ